MCRAVTCRTCGKTTWAGCGRHIEQVRSQVPPENWCDGHHEGSGATQGNRPGLLRRLLGR